MKRGGLPSGDNPGQLFIWSSSRVWQLDDARTSKHVSSTGVLSMINELRTWEWLNTTVSAETNDCSSTSRNVGWAEPMTASVLREQFSS